MIELKEPSNEQERALAIRMCRVNAYLDPDTGLPVQNREDSIRLWKLISGALPLSKWLWMWNHGRDVWDTPDAATADGDDDGR